MKTLKIIFFTIISITSIFFLIYLINTIVWGIAMQPHYRIESTKEFDEIGLDIEKEFKTNSSNFFDNRINIEKCIENKSNKKHIFPIEIGPIYNNKYFDKKMAKQKIDSIYIIINNKLPHKKCFDTISIKFWAIDSTKEMNKLVYDTILKYPVVK